MRLRRLLCLLSLFFFVVEVLNPVTVFVREYVGTIPCVTPCAALNLPMSFRAVKKESQRSAPKKAQQEYVDASAIVPQFFSSPKPTQVGNAPVVVSAGEPQLVHGLIPRPPSSV